MDEKRLVNGILKGEESYLRLFYKTHSSMLTAFIRKKIGDEKDVEEIFQDSLFAFLEALRDFTFACSLKTFLFAIAKRKIVDFYRKKKIKKILFSQMPEVESLLGVLVSPETTFDEKLLRQSIEKTLKLLKPRYRKILRLKYIEGFSVMEIARKLAITFKSAESTLFRARKDFTRLYPLV